MSDFTVVSDTNPIYAEIERLKRERDKLAEALKNIAADGTTYPPAWNKFSAEDKLKFPPIMTWAAKKARAALAQVRK